LIILLSGIARVCLRGEEKLKFPKKENRGWRNKSISPNSRIKQ